MTYSIRSFVDSLPETSLTTRVLGALAPGEWQNVTSFEEMVSLVTGEMDSRVIQAVGQKAIALWFDLGTGYQNAMTIYKLIAAEAPSEDRNEGLDAALKLGAELAAYGSMHGLSRDRVGDFLDFLRNATKDDAMRFLAWIALDVVLPLGADAGTKLVGAVREADDRELASHRVFRLMADGLPGDLAAQRRLLTATVEGVGPAIEANIQAHSLHPRSVLEKVRQSIDVAGDERDLDAAVAAVRNEYFEHTGIQSVARRVITRAHRELYPVNGTHA